jgi:hypothetical protein
VQRATNTFTSTGQRRVFLTGLSFPLPDSFANAGGRVTGPVVWLGPLGSDTTCVSVGWKVGAAVYTTFSTDYHTLQILPTHGNFCTPAGGGEAATPEGFAPSGISFKGCRGRRQGRRGSDFTGSWNGTGGAGISTGTGSQSA